MIKDITQNDITRKAALLTKLGLIIFIIIAIVIAFPFGTISAGERGIRLRFGAPTGEVLGEGLYFRIPLIESVVRVNVQIQKEQTTANAASRDLQTVNSDVALNFRPDPTKVINIYRELGTDYKINVIAPALQESMKAATAKYTAEELITKRGQVAQDVISALRERLQPRGIIVEDFSIVNFDFSKAFNEAIENKVSAEQNALAAQNKLKQVEYEAQQQVAQAKGEAEAINVKSQALRSNPEVLQLEAIQKWDGKMPQYNSGQLPFITVK
jgi:regulator of protease activity HflC (stomatin/prohibitin superfamily)